jgi:hypothetical protein
MGKQTGCYANSIAANSYRRKSEPADDRESCRYHAIRRIGVGIWLGIGCGPEWGVQQTSVGGLLKFGMLCDVELRWSTTSFLSQTDASGRHRSFGDNWLGPQIRVYRQTKRVPTLAFAYAIKIPSASTKDGLGTGHVDHAFTFLASKDIAQFHFDFNFTQFLIGRPNTSGFDKNQQLNLALSFEEPLSQCSSFLAGRAILYSRATPKVFAQTSERAHSPPCRYEPSLPVPRDRGTTFPLLRGAPVGVPVTPRYPYPQTQFVGTPGDNRIL